eukprot:7865192-Lingulodinium_polyedra.AAC.1
MDAEPPGICAFGDRPRGRRPASFGARSAGPSMFAVSLMWQRTQAPAASRRRWARGANGREPRQFVGGPALA